jgi:hypothetical protein
VQLEGDEPLNAHSFKSNQGENMKNLNCSNGQRSRRALNTMKSATQAALAVAALGLLSGCGSGSESTPTSRASTDAAALNASADKAQRLTTSQPGAPRAGRATISPSVIPSTIISSPRSLAQTPGQVGLLSAEIEVAAASYQFTWISVNPAGTPIACTRERRDGNIAYCLLEPSTLANNGSLVSIRVVAPGETAGFESRPATITVTAAAVVPSMLEHPVGQTVPAGQMAEFSALVTGTQVSSWPWQDRTLRGGLDGLRYQWLKNGVAIPGAYLSTMRLQTTAADIGTPQDITLQVQNAAGTVTSEVATMTVLAAETTVAATGAKVPGPAGATLALPAGALPSGTTVSVTAAPVPTGLLPAGVRALGDMLVISSSAAGGLAQPAELEFDGPEELPPGSMLALIELDGPARVSANGQARALPANVSCIHPQSARSSARAGGRFRAAVNFIGRLVATVLPASACTEVQSRPTSPLIPFVTDTACVSDDDFSPIGDSGLSVDAYTLVSRHVDCRRSAGQLVRLDVDIDITRNPTTGQITGYRVVTNPGGDPGPNTTRNRLTYGEALIQSRMSIFGPSSSVSKQVSIQARVLAFYPDVSYPLPSGSIPGAPRFASVTVQPQVACTTEATNSVNPTCGKGEASEITLQLPPAGPPQDRPWVNSSVYSMNFDWTKPTGQYADFESFRANFDRFNYKLAGAKYEIAGTGPNFEKSWVSSNLGTSPWIRCDRRMVQVDSSGCIFRDAAAVFDVNAIVTADDAIAHIAAAQRGIGHPLQPQASPGKFKMLAGSIAVADPSVTGGMALQRLKDRVKQNDNRDEACSKNANRVPLSIIRSRLPTNGSAQCTSGGTVNEGAPCSCDEYPFASTWQGALSGNRDSVSAKFILDRDNKAAGTANLTNALKQMRVADFTDHSVTNATMNPNNDNYWVWTGPED